jgi:choline dehydrogenase-like flavoprotein
LSYATKFEKGLEDVFIAAEEVGMGVNPDVNSGNPIGMGMGAACMYQGARTTAAAYLENAPSNLTVAVNSTVAKVILSGKKAKGIKTIDSKEYHAKKDVILSGGALNSPQLLMLSGIGPADELQKHGIPSSTNSQM